MSRAFLISLCLLVGAVLAGSPLLAESPPAGPEWSMNATLIEACSCPMFCTCYFNAEPAAHHDHASGGEAHFCRFNNAFQVNSGSFGEVSLAGAKFWVSGDLGGDFHDKMDWAVLTFDKAVTPEQREGIAQILGKLYPVEWRSFSVGPDADMTWQATADRAEAKLDAGKTAEVVLNRFPGMTDEPVVIKNLVYWGAPRNEGFVLMPNEVEAWRVGDKAFEFKGGNGFMITVDISSKDMS